MLILLIFSKVFLEIYSIYVAAKNIVANQRNIKIVPQSIQFFYNSGNVLNTYITFSDSPVNCLLIVCKRTSVIFISYLWGQMKFCEHT